jgi:predicted PurR-regulated permease PerM
MLWPMNAMPDEGRQTVQRMLSYGLVLAAGYLAYLVLKPFLAPLAWAGVLSMMLQTVHDRLARRIGSSGSALVTTILAAFLVVAPAVVLVSVVAQQIPQVLDYVQEASATAPARVERLWEALRTRSLIPLPSDPMLLVRESTQRLLAFLAPRAGAAVADLAATLGSLFVMLFALFFMLRDGQTLGRALRDLLPLPRHECDRLVKDTRELVLASVGAGLLVAAAQGAIGGLVFWLLGIRAPLIWGMAIGLCSLLPVVGAALVWVPAGLWLLVSGDIWSGVVLLVTGTLGISMADNLLRPILLSGRTSASGLVVFLGLLGGVAAFGFIGLVLGPIVLVTAGNLFRMFTRVDLSVESP